MHILLGSLGRLAPIPSSLITEEKGKKHAIIIMIWWSTIIVSFTQKELMPRWYLLILKVLLRWKNTRLHRTSEVLKQYIVNFLIENFFFRYSYLEHNSTNSWFIHNSQSGIRPLRNRVGYLKQGPATKLGYTFLSSALVKSVFNINYIHKSLIF